jgi:hypothetical protein
VLRWDKGSKVLRERVRQSDDQRKNFQKKAHRGRVWASQFLLGNALVICGDRREEFSSGASNLLWQQRCHQDQMSDFAGGTDHWRSLGARLRHGECHP